jgi:hypothetical protein
MISHYWGKNYTYLQGTEVLLCALSELTLIFIYRKLTVSAMTSGMSNYSVLDSSIHSDANNFPGSIALSQGVINTLDAESSLQQTSNPEIEELIDDTKLKIVLTDDAKEEH